MVRDVAGHAGARNASASDTIAQVNAALKGPVIDILAAQIPEFSRLPRDILFERIMTDPQLGAGCFKLFRARPELFAPVLSDPHGNPVSRDSETLSCGRTLSAVITIIVRNMARRYFRLRLNPATSPIRTSGSALTHFLDRLEDRAERLIHRFWRAKRQHRRGPPPPPSPGEALYRALRDFLLHDWQVRLLPRYSTLPLAVAASVGPQLLGCREPEDIDALLTNYKVDRPSPVAAIPIASDPPSPVTPSQLEPAPQALYRVDSKRQQNWRSG